MSQSIRPRRQPRWIAVGVLAIVLGGLGAGLLWSRATHTSQVVIAQRTIARGEQIRPSDFRVVEVGDLAGTSAIPGSALASLEGKRALVDLMAGALVPEGAVGVQNLERGSTQVGLKLAPGRIPSGELAQGSAVRLIPLDDPRALPTAQQAQSAPTQTGQSAGQQRGGQPAVNAVVLTPPRVSPDGSSTLLDVRVESQTAETVAELAATDRLALVKDGGR